MASAARKLRTRFDQEDADLGCWSFVVVPDEDALDHAVRFHELWPAWHCDCGTRNEGRRISCKYCGEVRSDVDL